MLACNADAANFGNKHNNRDASAEITTQIGKSADTVSCYVYNKSDKRICVKYDVYPVWNFNQPVHGTVSEFIPAKNGRSIAWAFPSQQASMQCKLISAVYIPWDVLCP
jgi:hypothetical protein